MTNMIYRNGVERLAVLIGRDDPDVQRVVSMASRNSWFHDSALRLLYGLARQKGLDPGRTDPFYKLINPAEVAGPILIAKEKYHGCPVGPTEQDLGESFLAAGRPGTFKTSVLENMIIQWVGLGNTIFAISVKRDFIGLVNSIPHCCVMPVEDLRFNPLQPPCPSAANRHAQMIANVARKNFGSLLSGEVTMYQAIDDLYGIFGVKSGKAEDFPTMFDLRDYITNQYVAPHTEAARARERLLKRLELICRALGQTINVSKGMSIKELLDCNVVLLVDRLIPDVRDFLVECILVSMFTYRIEYGERL